MKKVRYLSAFLCLLIGMSSNLESQESPVAGEDTTPVSEAETGDEAEPETENIYDEIVVTGGLIEDSLQDTPESVAVWGSDRLTDAGLGQIRDIFNQTANAYQVNNGEGFGIRGINHTSVGTGGSGELGSYYVDGVALTGFAKRIGPMQLWDVEQVEILRGPQTTNVGRNALAGAIVLATKEPVFRNESQWRFGLSEESTWEIAGIVNAPLSESSAIRVTAETWNTDGFVSNPTRGEDDFDARENSTFRLKYLYQPASRSDLSLLVSAQYSETSRGDDVIELTDGSDQINLSNIGSFAENESVVLSADLRWDIADRWNVRSITSLLESDTFQVTDDDRLPTGGMTSNTRDSADKNWAQDVRFEFLGDGSRGVLGLYYTEVEDNGAVFGSTNLTPQSLGIPDFLLPFYPEFFLIGLDSPFDIETRNFAAFGHWDWELSDRWRAFAGLRWDREEQSVDETISTTLLSEIPDTRFLPPPIREIVEAVNAALLAQTGSNSTETETDYDALLPELGISYSWSDSLTASLFLKRGYRAGGASVTTVGRLNEFDPETLDMAEFSVRSSVLDNRLTLNTNLYFGNWQDQQVSIQQSDNSFDFLIENAGESEIYGVEIDFTYRPQQAAWDVYGSLGYASTEFTDFVSAQQGDLTGNRFSLAPEWTAALGFNYRFGGGWFVHGDAGYQSEAFTSVQNEPEFVAEERTIINIRGGYETARYSIVGFVQNLTDEVYLISAFSGRQDRRLGRLGNPRQAGLQLTFRF